MIEDIVTPLAIISLPHAKDDGRRGFFGQPRKHEPHASPAVAVTDVASSLGMSVGDIPAAVQDAVQALVGEVDRLRAEVEQARHFEAFLGAEADQHPLLPILNRRAFQRELTRLLDATEREELTATVACLHIGGLEDLRLRRGLAARDQALLRSVDIMRSELRQIDLLGYFDGGDFGLALAVADADGAVAKVQCIATALKDGLIVGAETPFEPVIRVGLVHFQPGLSTRQVLAACEAKILGAPEPPFGDILLPS